MPLKAKQHQLQNQRLFQHSQHQHNLLLHQLNNVKIFILKEAMLSEFDSIAFCCQYFVMLFGRKLKFCQQISHWHKK
jgi:hypothetical protein